MGFCCSEGIVIWWKSAYEVNVDRKSRASDELSVWDSLSSRYTAILHVSKWSSVIASPHLDRDSFLSREVRSSCCYTLSRFLAANRQGQRALGSLLAVVDTAAAVHIRAAAADVDVEGFPEEAVVAKSHIVAGSIHCWSYVKVEEVEEAKRHTVVDLFRW
jgi:hypothetical protein